MTVQETLSVKAIICRILENFVTVIICYLDAFQSALIQCLKVVEKEWKVVGTLDSLLSTYRRPVSISFYKTGIFFCKLSNCFEGLVHAQFTLPYYIKNNFLTTR